MAEELTREQRILVAKLSGAAIRLGRSADSGVSELRGISDDPVLLGVAAAFALVELERNPRNRHAARALQLLYDAGADELALLEEAVHARSQVGHPPHST